MREIAERSISPEDWVEVFYMRGLSHDVEYLANIALEMAFECQASLREVTTPVEDHGLNKVSKMCDKMMICGKMFGL